MRALNDGDQLDTSLCSTTELWRIAKVTHILEFILRSDEIEIYG